MENSPFLQLLRLNTFVSCAQNYLLCIAFMSWLQDIAQFYSEQVCQSQIHFLSFSEDMLSACVQLTGELEGLAVTAMTTRSSG